MTDQPQTTYTTGVATYYPPGENPIQAAIDAAVAAERERCAKIAEEAQIGAGYSGSMMARYIAQKIRCANAE